MGTKSPEICISRVRGQNYQKKRPVSITLPILEIFESHFLLDLREEMKRQTVVRLDPQGYLAIGVGLGYIPHFEVAQRPAVAREKMIGVDPQGPGKVLSRSGRSSRMLLTTPPVILCLVAFRVED